MSTQTTITNTNTRVLLLGQGAKHHPNTAPTVVSIGNLTAFYRKRELVEFLLTQLHDYMSFPAPLLTSPPLLLTAVVTRF